MTLSFSKVNVENLIKRLIIFSIIKFFPTHKWYWTAYKMTKILARFKTQFNLVTNNSFGIIHSTFLNHTLGYMTRFQKPFFIPIRAKGIELFEKERANGLVICSIHIPLTKVALRYLIENDIKPTAAIVGDPNLKNDFISVWGINEKIPAIRTGAFVLNKAKSILQQGGSIVALVDVSLGGRISPNIFRLAHKLQSDVVFLLAELMPDGFVEVSFFETTTSEQLEEAVNNQIAELQAHLIGILNRYGNLNALNILTSNKVVEESLL